MTWPNYFYIMRLTTSALFVTIFLEGANAHLGAWHKGVDRLFLTKNADRLLGMYCKKGTSGRDDKDTNTVVQPMRDVNPTPPLFSLFLIVDSAAQEPVVVPALESGIKMCHNYAPELTHITAAV